MFNICKYQLKQSLRSPRTYIALLIGVIIVIIDIIPFIEFSKSIGETLNIFDAFIYYNSNRFNVAITFFGLLILISDIPFTTQNETYIILRTSRIKWVLGKMLYLLVMCAFYYLVLLIVSIVFSTGLFNIGNEWGEPLYALAKDENLIYSEQYDVYFGYNYILAELTPVSATLISIGLDISYGFIMSLFTFLMNLLFPIILGYIFSMLMHILNYILVFVFTTFNFIKYSILGNNLLIYHNFNTYEKGHFFLTLNQSYLLNIAIIMILAFLIVIASKKYDFKTVVNSKE